MRMGEIYVCKECGLELQVIKECRDAGTAADACGCHQEEEVCSISCCEKEMEKKF
jgi:hypothetical protein